jgi:hypothetical protein
MKKVLNNFGVFGMQSQTPLKLVIFSDRFFTPSGNMGELALE